MTHTPGTVAEILSAARLIPVLTIERLDRAVPLARALVAGGVRTLEITLRTAAGGDAAAAIQAEVPDAIVGLGTVVRRADLGAGAAPEAALRLQPRGDPRAARRGGGTRRAVHPGGRHGLGADRRDGARLHDGEAVPRRAGRWRRYAEGAVRPVPLGAVQPNRRRQRSEHGAYLALKNVVAVGGSWLATPADIEAEDWAGITAKCQRAMAAARA